MTKDDFFSTKSLEKQITNRKMDVNNDKVQWMKIQWLNYKKEQPFMFLYKYSNNTEYPFNSVYIEKRNSHIEDYTKQLDLFYSNVHSYKTKIKKKKDLLELIPLILPIRHNF